MTSSPPSPRLRTDDGLVINACHRGAPGCFGGEDGPAAAIALSAGDGRRLATARSGFACGTFCPASVRVPSTPPDGPLRLTADFDSGPLAGRLHAEAAAVGRPSDRFR